MTRPTTNRTEATDMAEQEDLDSLRFRAGALALTIKELQEALKPMRDELEARSPRRSSVSPEIPGTTVAVARLERKRDSRSIAGWDSAEAIAWGNEHYPSEIELVEQFREAIRDRFVLTDDGQIVGPKGELDIPGLFVATSPGSFAITPNRDAAPALFQSLRDVTLRELIAGAIHE
jgi:hypothetical protein